MAIAKANTCASRKRCTALALALGVLVFHENSVSIGAVTITNEFWIQSGTNGGNLGTLQDPFCITAATNFDTLMSRLTTANLPRVFHLLPGLYTTAGNNSWHLRSNSRLLGSGIDVTTVRIQNGGPRGGFAIFCGAPRGPCADNTEVCDMTLDANGQSNTNSWSMGVVVYGTRSVIRRVKVVNPIGSASARRESFPIFIDGLAAGLPLESLKGNTIENCEVTNVLGNSCSAIVLRGEGSILNCHVYFPPLNATNSHMAYNCPSGRNVRIIGNYSEGGVWGFYVDTGACTNVLIANNVFRNCAYGVEFNTGTNVVDGVSIVNNIVEISTNKWVYPRMAINQYSHARNFTITGNIFRSLDPRATGCNSLGLNWLTGGVVSGNRWDLNLPVTLNAVTNLVLYDNFDLSGNFATNTGVNQVAPVNGIYRRTVTSSTALSRTDKYVGVQTTANIVITLPSAASTGQEIIVSAETSAPNIKVSALPGQHINNTLSSVLLTVGYTSLKFIADGATSSWFTY